jgi:hypothetical protein
MRIVFALFIAISSAVLSPAKAQTYYVDLALVPTVPGTGGGYVAGYAGAGGDILYEGTQSPIYDLSSLGIPSGSTIIFGELSLQYLGSGLIDYSQKMTVATIQMADMKVCAHRS